MHQIPPSLLPSPSHVCLVSQVIAKKKNFAKLGFRVYDYSKKLKKKENKKDLGFNHEEVQLWTPCRQMKVRKNLASGMWRSEKKTALTVHAIEKKKKLLKYSTLASSD